MPDSKIDMEEIKMDMLELMKARHSVRQYTDRKIEQPVRDELMSLLQECNEESGLNMQIVFDEPDCFDSMMAHYGKFKGASNYIALIGKKSADLDEKCGYYGEKLVLKAQELGLNTCWVAMTYGKGKCAAKTASGEKRPVIIALGYGENQGVAHKNKELSAVCNCAGHMPDWFAKGMEGALLAPTAINQQKFYFTLEGDRVTAKAGKGFYTKVDLGIAKYHFEALSGHKVN